MPLKKCEKCGEPTGVRAKKCPKCGLRYCAKVKRPTEKLDTTFNDWTKLRPGDIIKVSGGPFFDGINGPVSMGHNGIFKVQKLHKDGILASGKKDVGFFFINMTTMGFDKNTGLNRVAHKIKKVKSV